MFAERAEKFDCPQMNKKNVNGSAPYLKSLPDNGQLSLSNTKTDLYASSSWFFWIGYASLTRPLLPHHAWLVRVPPNHQTRYTDPMLVQCWSSVTDAGPTLSQHRVSASCWLGGRVLVQCWASVAEGGPTKSQHWKLFCYSVGPTSTTLAQNCDNIGSLTPRVWR